MKWKIELNDSVYIIVEKNDQGIKITGFPRGIERMIIYRERNNDIYFSLEYEMFACIDLDTNQCIKLRGPYTSLEIRNLYEKHKLEDPYNIEYSMNKDVFDTHNSFDVPTLRTELHTHFLEMLDGKEFLDLMSKYTKKVPIRDNCIVGKLYKGEYLDQMETVDLFEMRENGLYEKFCSQLSIEVTGQVPFERLEEVTMRRSNVITYAARALAAKLGKDPTDFQEVAVCRATIYIDMLKAALKSLKNHSIEYVEFSYSTTNTIVMIQDYVKNHPLEFSDIDFNILFSMSRNAKKSSMVERSLRDFKMLVDKGYVKGFDLMGQEQGLTTADITNLDDPKSFISVVKSVLEILDGKEDKVLRLHAGENQSSRDNPLYSLRVIDDLYTKHKCCSTLPQIRIGHGLYFPKALSDNLVEYKHLLQKYGVVVEINATSNFTLSNINSLTSIPYRWYLENDIPIVLATDGAGMYLTDALQEKVIALLFGGKDVVKSVEETESKMRGRL